MSPRIDRKKTGKLLGLMTGLLVAGILMPQPTFALEAPAKSAPANSLEFSTVAEDNWRQTSIETHYRDSGTAGCEMPAYWSEGTILRGGLALSIGRWLHPIERRILEQVIEELYPFWPWANLNIDWSEWPLILYRADFLIMAGASEIAEIDRYPSIRTAVVAFGDPTDNYRGYPAKVGRSQQSSNGHYQDAPWIEWRIGKRIFKSRTSYNSTYPGEARDPAIIAETLFEVAFCFGLSEGQFPPLYIPPADNAHHLH